jgi:histidyl-tRNA synthetase
LGLTQYLKLEINNIGSAQDRKKYAQALTAYLSGKVDELDDDARNRMHSNPMRILDSKNEAVRSALVDAPKLCDFVNRDSKTHFRKLKELLTELEVQFIENNRLVRGLDYYNNCVYEWTTDTLGAQGAVCGGGRYDGLVRQLGGRETEACGFAIGIERLVLMLRSLNKIPASALRPTDVYLVVVGGSLESEAFSVAEAIREKYPHLGVICHCAGGKFNSQMKRAYNSGARVAVVLERDGEATGPLMEGKIRSLDDGAESIVTEIDNIPEKIGKFFGNSEV